eukprot:TRINITY_DN393_c0_g1_i1.p1 TRINITY_DN393_c0_g1~~TRINITY_DN393_c0_g1_i1.p1  ORF type:complete len:234 (-),score=24.17 TRINITY_DN393_c0_g1_i1:78-779(-)
MLLKVVLLIFLFGGVCAQFPNGTRPLPGVFGLDISSPISKSIDQSHWDCLKSHGNYLYAIIQGYQGGYGLNTFIDTAVARAWAGGMEHVDVYAFMCKNCYKNGPSAVKELVDFLAAHHVKHGMIWLDIEQCSNCWSPDLSENCAFVSSLVDEYERLGAHIGIYSSNYEWGATVGHTCNRFTHLPIWYAHYDGNPSFSDWPSTRFGGWEKPAIKQFADKADNSCGVSIDRDWYP